MKKLIAILGFAAGSALSMQAEVKLPAYFTDNMVIQQQTEMTIKGTAKPGKQLKLTTGWDNKTQSATINSDGTWSVTIATPQAGGPYTLTFDDGKKLQLKNVMVGEVWFCSGQSNMEMPLAGWGKVMNYEQEIANANYPDIRLFKVEKITSITPLDNVTSINGWQECSPTTIPEFSSLAYFYGRELWKNLNVPIGLIDSSWGGTPAEAWTSFGTVKQIAGFEEQTSILEQYSFKTEEINKVYNQMQTEWQRDFIAKDQGLENGLPRWADSTLNDSNWSEMALPGQWEGQGMPDFNGVVWFRYTIDIPGKWNGKALTLRLGMVDDEDITYWNGQEIARGSGFNVQRSYQVPASIVKGGKATITVRVSDFGGEGGIYGATTDMYVEHEGERISLAQNWKYSIGVDLSNLGAQPMSPTGNPSFPSTLFNAMVSPMTGFPIKGAIWYQGEANENNAYQYADLFPAMIQDWRAKWGYNFPFYFVQLANFRPRMIVEPDSKWAFLREAQAKALNLVKTGMAVNIDCGLADDIHPKNKQEVGRRLALIALKNSYDKPVVDQAPCYAGYRVMTGKIAVVFDTTESEKLNVRGGAVKGFTIAGADHKFYPAEACIEGNVIYVSSPEVPMPLAVRYAWADNPEATLYGDNDLPVAPFRTDSW